MAFGVHLFDAVFKGDVKLGLVRCLDAAHEQNARVRVRLRLSDASELATLPWEYLYWGEPDHDYFLALSDKLSVVRFPERTEAVSALPVRPPLRILVVVASPSDLAPLDGGAEWTLVETALKPAIDRGRLELDRCVPATLDQLDLLLRQRTYHVLHFIGHGAFAAPAGTNEKVGTLVLENGTGRSATIDSRRLSWLIHNHDTLRLVVLNTCEGARAEDGDALTGLAQRLVQTGVPAVIAMQREISDEAARVLAEEFYRVLGEGEAIDTALTSARTRLMSVGSQIEWATPALYMRALDPWLFDIQPTSDRERREFRLSQLDRLVQGAIVAEDWHAVVNYLETMSQLDPTAPGISARMKHALIEKELAELFERGRQHYDIGRMEQAFDCFSQVYNLSRRNYKGIWSYIDTARRELLKGTPEVATAAHPSSVVSMGTNVETHYETFLKSVLDEGIVIVLGGDVNLCSRMPGLRWKKGSPYPPTRRDLAEYLAGEVRYPSGSGADLVAISQYYVLKEGLLALREKLRSIFDAEFNPPALHRLLAMLPNSLRSKGYTFKRGYPMIINTNYDTCLEQAFDDAGEEYDLLAYVGDGETPATFLHRSPDGVIHQLGGKANEYMGILSEPTRTVIVKVHAAISAGDAESASYVVAEDDYIDYPSGKELVTLLPKTVLLKFKRSRLVFFGYTPHDWSLRVFFRRIWGAQAFTGYKSYAVASEPNEIDEDFWKMRFVDVMQAQLDTYVAVLSERLDGYPLAGPQP
jgi:hypothetical protein